MDRKILFHPAFDKTDHDPKKNYGVGCLELFFMVEGSKGIVEFQLLTNWYQEHIMKRRLEIIKKDVLFGEPDYLLENFINPYPADICYFSLTRLSEDDAFFEDGLKRVFDGKPCFYGYKYTDENGFVAKDVAYWLLVEHGEDALWKYLEEYYYEVFGRIP